MTRLEIRLLGPMTVTVDGAEATFPTEAARALLAYLALNRDRPTPRDLLAGLVWPEWPDADALRNVRRALHRLRTAISDPEAQPPFLTITRQFLQLNPDADIRIDVDAFRNLVGEARADARPSLSDCPACVERLVEAADLYQGDLLAGFSLDSAAFEAWLTVEREAVRRQALEVLETLTDHFAAADDQRRALDYAQQQLALDPLRESAHRQAMRALALSDQRAAALAQFESCRQVLRTDLGVEPDPATTALYEQIRDGAFPTPSSSPTREPRAIGRCPYRGLSAFREVDAPFFFGREAFVDRLAHAVATQPLVVMIVGASGAGKSSVVAAGLLPRLRTEGGWTVASLRPGREPFHAVSRALFPLMDPNAREADRLIQTRALARALTDGEVQLTDLIVRVHQRHPDAPRLLVLVDQFEELYTVCPDPETRRAFIDALLDVVGDSGATRRALLSVLIVLRADFMGQALAHRPMADALQDASQLLGPMTRDELRAAVERPAEVQGAAFEPGLVERLLDDVADEPGYLPLLEFALTLLWERNEAGWLTHEAYDAIGRVEGALARYADEVYDELPREEQLGARRVFTQLVQPGEGTEDTRRVSTRAELAGPMGPGEATWDLVQRLADRRLVVTAVDTLSGAQTVEVVHEALIQHWAQLQGWMAEDRAFRTWQERLRVALRTWEDTGRDEGALPRGAPLAEAEGWLAERPDEIGLAERIYIEEGVELRHRSMARLRRRAVYLSLALVVALIAAAVAGVLGRRNADLAADNALIAEEEAGARATAQSEADVRGTAQASEAAQRAVAEQQREEALRQAAIGLASEATLQMQGPDQDLAVLLALEAVENYPYTWQAERALGEGVRDFRLIQKLPNGSSIDIPSAFPDGTRLLTAAADCFFRVWDAQTLENLLTVDICRPIGGSAVRAWLSPSGDRVLTVSHEGVPKVWDAETGELLLELAGHGGLHAQWSPDGRQVLSYASQTEDTAVVWDAGTGRVIHVLPGSQGIVGFASFSPDGAWIATSAGQIWDAATGQLHQQLSGYEDRITRDTQLAISWAPDGEELGAGIGTTARVWDAETGGETLVLDTEYQGRSKLWWSPAGNQILSVSLDEIEPPTLWDANTGQRLRQLAHAAELTWRTDPWSPEGDRIVLPGGQGRVRMWEASTGRELLELPVHENVREVGWLSDHQTFITTDRDALNKVWRVSTARLEVGCRPDCSLDEFSQALGGFARRPAWSPDGKLVARQFAYGKVVVWDADTGQETLRIQQADRGFMNAIAWSPDGAANLTLTGPAFGSEGELELWDAATGASLRKPAEGCGGWEARWSPDGQRIVTYGFGAPAEVWDVESGNLVSQNTDHDPWNAAWSPDGTRLISGDGMSQSGPVIVWDAQTGETLLTLLPDDFPYGTAAVAWSPDGTRIVTFSEDRLGRIWDAHTGRQIASFGSVANAYGAAWSPGGSRFSVSTTSGIKVWDAASLEQIMVYPAGSMTWGSWSPDGTAMAIAVWNGDLKVYPAWESLEDLIAYAKDCCVLRELTPEERAQYGLPEG